MSDETEFENEDMDMPETFIPIMVWVRSKERAMPLLPISVPAAWLDNLAFSGAGFAVTMVIQTEITLPAGSVVRVELGRYEEEGNPVPPFDPPYASNARATDKAPLYPGGPPEG